MANPFFAVLTTFTFFTNSFSYCISLKEMKNFALLQVNLLHLISTIAIFSAAIIPIYISINIKAGNKLRIRAITIMLTIFIIIHGFYNIFALFGYSLITKGFFEPLSA